jgi:hypothetical protein
MFRALVIAALVAVVPAAARAQTPVVVHIRVTLVDAARTTVPIARHALLISDNPATGSPRRVVTGPAGTVDVRLRPGNYTFESDEPLSFGGKGYQWTQTLDVPAGRDFVLELTAANAELVTPSALSSSTTPENDPSLLFAQWKDSVVAVWAESRSSGFIVDAAGLVVTSQRNISNGGSATNPTVDVQLSTSVKVEARVLVADRARDVAVLWIDPGAAAASKPIPLGCGATSQPSFAVGQKLVAIGVPFRGDKELSPGNVIVADAHTSVADFRLASGSTGGPVFTNAGTVAGVSSSVDGPEPGKTVERSRRDARVVSVEDVCAAVASAKMAMQTAPQPSAAKRPVDPSRQFAAGVLEAQAARRAGSLNGYRVSSADFDVAFLTPVMIYNAMKNAKGRPTPETDFGDWSDYFDDAPPVLVMRITPKQTESFWTTVARGALYTQGAALPPIKHFKPGFSRLSAFCGETEVTPIHPFTHARRVSETDAVREGLYVFDSRAFGPHCTSVKLVLLSEKPSAKPDTKTVDPPILQQVWDDFAAYRAGE